MSCVVVVDAWKTCEEDDIERFPWLEKETKLFGSFLNLQLENLKQRYNFDIIHCASGLEIMEEIKIRDLIVHNITEVPNYNYYYFCGFHLGRCINKKIKDLKKTNSGVIINLSMLFPEDSYASFLSKHPNNYFYYSYQKGLECIDMKT